MNKFVAIVLAILGINLVIVVHEFGHFAAAKLFGVRTPTFSIGFDPAIYSRPIGKTNFQIGILPLGGYVSIEPYDFEHQSLIKKLIIIFAGIALNFLFAFLIFGYLYRKRCKTQECAEVDSASELVIQSKPDQAQELLSVLGKQGFIGPIGIISMIADSARIGFDVFIYILAIVSLNIGFLNLIPVPFFDGGQALKVILNAGSGQQVSLGETGWLSYFLLALLIIFAIYIAIRDIIKIKRG